MVVGGSDAPQGDPTFDLSAAQRGIWFAQQALGSIPINIAEYVELTGPIDRDALTAACNRIGREAGSGFLRLLDTGDVPRQWVDDARDESIGFHDMSEEADPRAAALEWMRADHSRPLDVLSDRLTIAELFRLGPDHHLWYWRAHHIAMDGFGATAMLSRASEIYRAVVDGREPPPWKGATLQEVVDSERAYRASSRFDKDREYWAERNEGLPAAMSLASRREPPGEYSRLASVELTGRVADLVDAAAAEAAGSPAPAVIAAFSVYLSRMLDVEDVVLSLPVSARNTAKLRSAAGMVSNIVPLRVQVPAEASIASVLTDTQTALTGALRRQLYRHEDMRRDLGQGTGERGLFGPSVNLMMFQSQLDLGEATGAVHVLTTGPVEDLAVNIYPGAAGHRLRIDLEANPRLYDDVDLAEHLDRFVGLLESFLGADRDAAVGTVSVGSPEELDTVVRRWNATEHPVADDVLPALRQARAASAPDVPALVVDDAELSQGEFGARVARLARHLVQLGVGPDTHVAVAIRRSVEMMVAIHAVVDAGGAYVPIDLDSPADRVAAVLDGARPVVVLTSSADGFVLPADLDDVPAVLVVDELDLAGLSDAPVTDADRLAPLRPDHTAYVIYTSGSTGRPKGVAVTHRAIVNRLQWMQGAYPLDGTDAVLQKTPVTFDVSVWELFWPLQVGARLVVAAPDGHRDPEYLARLIAERAVTTVHFVPSMLALFVESAPAASLTSLRRVFASGEALTPTVAARLSAITGADLHNLYGPTEAAVDVTHHPFDATADTHSVPIGRPVWNTTVHVLDRQLRPTVVGAVGELYLGGVQLARAYVGDPAQTSGRFVAAPFGAPGERMYRTGDLVRWSRDGELEYVGRSDFQVKVRGLRIELGEIEAAVLADPAVRETVVTVHESPQGQRLVAYVVATSGKTVDTASVVAGVRARVPGYMVPDAVVVLDAMPLGGSGKVDRKRLPAPDFSAHAAPFRAPVTETERTLVGVIEDLLGRDGVGLDDSFFGLGGDSIMSIQLVSRARELGLRFTSRQVFEHKTIGELASAVQSETAVAEELPGGGVGEVDPTPILLRLAEDPAAVGPVSQSIEVTAPDDLDRDALAAALRTVADRHDVLRSRLTVGDGGALRHTVDAPGSGEIALIDVSPAADPDSRAWVDAVDSAVQRATDALDPASGRVGSVLLLHTGPGADAPVARLVIVLHHVVVDGVSWRILLPDLAVAYAQHAAGAASVDLPAVGTSMRRWARALTDLAGSAGVRGELDVWRGIVGGGDGLGLAVDPRRDTVGTLRRQELRLSPELTETLLTRIPQAFHAGVNDGLLTALALAVARWRPSTATAPDGAGPVVVELEGHGREEELLPGADLSRTVGWFTTAYPVALDVSGIDLDAALSGGSAAGEAVKVVKEQLAEIPDRGVGFGLLRYLDAQGRELLAGPAPSIGFNYLGRLAGADADGPWVPAGDAALRGTRGTDVAVRHAIDINATVVDTPDGPRLSATVDHPAGAVSGESVDHLVDLWQQALESVARHASSPEAGGYTPSDLDLVRITQSDIDSLERSFAPLVDVWPLTPLQTGLLFHAELSVGSVDLYTAQLVLDVTGVDPDRMQRAAQALVDRHATLRTAFVTAADGTPLQVVTSGVTVPFTVHDVSGSADPDDALATIARTERVTPFDMAHPPLLRFALVALGEDRWRLLSTNHHILLDGWSLPVFAGDLFALYAADGAQALPSPASYRSYLAWLASRDHGASVAAWESAMAGLDEPTLVAADVVGPDDGVSEQVDITVDDELLAGLQACARSAGITFNTVLQVAWALVLSRLTGRTDVVFGTTVSGRPPEVSGVESMLGLFINTLPVRVSMHDGDDVDAVLKRVAEEQADLLDHHSVGLADITAASGLDVLFDTMMVYESYPLDRDALSQATSVAGTTVTGADVVDATHYPLTVIALTDPSLRLSVKYLPSTVTAERASAVLDMLVRVLARIADAPRARVVDVDVLSDADRAELLSRNGFGDVPPARPLADLLSDAARMGAGRVAVDSPEGSITYDDLDARSSALARVLIARGIGPEQIVALGMGRSVEFMVGLWAVAKTGAAYLPVDMRYPTERIEHMLTDSGAVYGISTRRWADTRPGTVEWLDLDDPETTERLAGHSDAPVTAADRVGSLRVSNLAYMIYTSGTTGVPKGVAVTHGGLAALMAEQSDRFVLGPDSRTLHFASPSFDASVLELLLALAHGSTMVIAPTEVYGGEDLHDLLAGHRVTHGFVTPAALASVDPVGLDSLESVVVGGEACPPELVARWGVDRRMFNGYGPTEATCFADIAGPMVPGAPITIGRPVRGLTSMILDRRLQPVPPGVDGELYLSGPALARGYHARPGLSADRFIANPHGDTGSRMYRTGDVVRWVRAADGGWEVFYVGRSDFQVKVRGFRIELGEVDAAVASHPDVAFVTTIGSPLPAGTTALVSYVVPTPGATVDPTAIREHVGRTLPSHMVPSLVIGLDEIPLTRTGKLDRAALPAPDPAQLAGTGEAVAPRTAVESQLADILAEVLGLPEIGVTDSFFDLGGNSLVATRAAARLSTALGRRVAVREIFDNPTVEALARTSDTAGEPTSDGPALVAGRAGDRPVLSLSQQAMWLVNRLDPTSPAYNVVLPLRLRGELDVAALTASLRDVMGRQQSLRTVFPDSPDGPWQQVVSVDEAAVALDLVDVAADDQLDAAVRFAGDGFDVTAAVPLRARLFRDGTDHLLVVVMHHILTDGASLAPLARDLVTAYLARAAGTEPQFTPLPVQYVDFARWQRDTLGSLDDPTSPVSRHLTWWRETLAGAPDAIELPLDRPRPAQRTTEPGIVPVRLGPDVVEGLDALAHRTSTSMFMVVHAILASLLARLSAAEDIVVGTPVVGRGHPDLDDLVGMFVNSVALRTPVDPGESFEGLLDRVRDIDLAAFAHDHVPFENVVGAVVPRRATSHSPIYQVQLSYQNNEPASVSLPGLEVSVAADDTILGAKFDLTLVIGEKSDPDGTRTLAGHLNFPVDVFDAASVQNIAERLVAVAAAVAADPGVAVGDIDILLESERLDAAPDVAPTPVAAPTADDLPAMLAAAVDVAADDAVLDRDGSRVTFGELHERFEQLYGPMSQRGMDAEAIASIALTGLAPLVAAAPEGFTAVLDDVIARTAAAVSGVDLTTYTRPTGTDTPTAAPTSSSDEPWTGTPLSAWADRVAEDPTALAVRGPEGELTRGELDAAASRLARELIAHGVGADDVVGVLTPRSVNWVVALLAAWKAGASYLPLDPHAPAERALSVLGDTGSRVVVSTASETEDEYRVGLADAGIALIPLGDPDTDRRLQAHDDGPLPDRWTEPGALDRLAYVITTSGSTGKPKPTLVNARGIFNMYAWYRSAIVLRRGAGVLIAQSPRFDSTQKNIWNTLAYGCFIRVVSEGFDPEEVVAVLRDEDISLLNLAPSAYELLVEMDPDATIASIDTAVAGGEYSLPAVYRTMLGTKTRLLCTYGPTETAATSSAIAYDLEAYEPPPPGEVRDIGPIPMGPTIPNVRHVVLDNRLRPVPVGVVGELYIAGVAPARGYGGMFGLTAARFVADPWGPPGARMYRSGDLVRRLPGGDTQFIGRSDFQVKVRGLRIELGEIESALTDIDGIRQSLVVAHGEASRARLAAYVVGDNGRDSVAVDDVRRHLAARLPDYMVPEAIMVLDAFPLSVSGKTDRKALPEPDFGAADDAIAHVAPRTPLEEVVAGLFADAVDAERVGVTTSFFELGGNSLSAVRLASRLTETLGVPIRLRTLFEEPTVEQIARVVERSRGGPTAEGGDADPAADDAAPVRFPGPVVDRPDRIPLSLAQQRLWFINSYDTGSGAYNIPMTLLLTGDLDIDALSAALVDLVDRQQTLRTIYPGGPQGPHQVVVPTIDALPPVRVDDVRADEVWDRLREFATPGFDVSTTVPIRTALWRMADDGDGSGPLRHLLVFVVHHIASDGLSMRPLMTDLLTAYQARLHGGSPQWTPLSAQYVDFAIWQSETFGDAADDESPARRQLEFWRRTLAGSPELIGLATDRPRAGSRSGVGATQPFFIPPELHSRLVALSNTTGVSRFMLLHTALAVLLARLSNETDIVIGSPIDGRGSEQLDGIVGMFVNTLALRTEIGEGATVRELLTDIRRRDLEAFAHSDVPFEQVVDTIAPTRTSLHTPLFQVVLSVNGSNRMSVDLDGLTVDPGAIDTNYSKFDLTFDLTENLDGSGAPAGIAGFLGYAVDIFDAATVEAHARRLVRILEGMAQDPDAVAWEIPLLDAEESVDLVPVRGPATDAEGTLDSLLRAAAAAEPDRVAIVDGDSTITYRELDRRANRIAREIIARGHGAEDVVALGITRGIASVLAAWGVTRSGAAFVPVDPTYPADRVEHMLIDSRAVLGITTADDAARLPDVVEWLVLDGPEIGSRPDEPVEPTELVRPVHLEGCAYIIYTSGTTGKPKGVEVTHAGLAPFSAEQIDRYDLTPEARVMHFASPSFDASILELLMATGVGSTMVIIPPGTYGGDDLRQVLARHRVSHGFITPAALASVDPEGLDDFTHFSVGGEAVPTDLIARWAPGRSVLIGYGPTETTIMATITDPLVAGDRYTIGSLVRGASAVVLDARLRPTPIGVPGDLYVAGPGVARGYRDRPGLTAERFVADPYGPPGGVMYRTGDVVRWTRVQLDDGSTRLEPIYVGRSDHQVKVRGFRIELGEIESVLGAHPAVDYVYVLGVTGPTGDTALAAYVQPSPGSTIDARDLADHAAQTLPKHMVPSAITIIDALPLTPVGKIDRRALPAPEFLGAAREYTAPRTPMERIVANAFTEVLGGEQIGADDSFFDLGGNSLAATRAMARINESLGVRLGVRMLFETPGVADLAAAIEASPDLSGDAGRAAHRDRPARPHPAVAGPTADVVPQPPRPHGRGLQHPARPAAQR
ncbi:MAG: amino acid adenylation domain-containing protein [Gordonia paraffinivorans]